VELLAVIVILVIIMIIAVINTFEQLTATGEVVNLKGFVKEEIDFE